MSVERDSVRCCTLEIAGPDLTSQNDLTDRLRRLTGRSAPQAPLPELFASWGLRALDAIGISVPFTEAQLRMLSEGNFIAPGSSNALTDVFGIAPTTLDEGLRRLAERATRPASVRTASARSRENVSGSTSPARSLRRRLTVRVRAREPARPDVVGDHQGEGRAARVDADRRG